MSMNLYPAAGTDKWYFDSAAGNNSGITVVQKFGRNINVGTTLVPICIGGHYRTVQPAAATTLRIKAGGNANDTAAGTGARAVTLQGLDATGAEIEETIATAGASASAATSASFIRLNRAFVSTSGTYANLLSTGSTASHSAGITIENSAGTADWATINASTLAVGQSQIGCYSVPLGKRAFIHTINANVDSTKTADVYLFKRESILDAAAPYQALRIQTLLDGVSGPVLETLRPPLGPFPALTDLIWMAVATTSADVSIAYSIILEDT